MNKKRGGYREGDLAVNYKIIELFLGRFTFEAPGAVQKLVVLRVALDAFMFVWAWAEVAGAFVIPIEAHVRFLLGLLWRRTFGVLICWSFPFFSRAVGCFVLDRTASDAPFYFPCFPGKALAEVGGIDS